MARKDWYTVEEHKDHWFVRKVDDDFNTTGGYTVTKPTRYEALGDKKQDTTSTCDCFAGLAGKFCRHKQLIPIFEQAKAFNTGRLYSFDKSKWKEPQQSVAQPLIDLDTLEM
jgi:hypothetical protein